MAKVSIIVPVYNAEHFLNKTIDSIINQSFKDFEVLLIDDCSSDKSLEILYQYADKDKRVKIIRNTKNLGVAKTRNKGVEIASGEWIAFLDSDDYWEKDKLQIQLDALKQDTNAVISYTATAFCNESGNLYEYIMHAKNRFTYHELLRSNPISCSSVMVKRDVMLRHKMISDKTHEDYVAWAEILKENGYAQGVDVPLLVYRFVNNSKSSNRFKSAKMMINSYRAIGMNWIKAAYYTFLYSLYSISYRRNLKRRSNLENNSIFENGKYI